MALLLLLARVGRAGEGCSSFGALGECVPPGIDLRLAPSGSRNVWALCWQREPATPIVRRWDGCRWREQPLPEARPRIGTALWARADDDVWVADSDGLSGCNARVHRWNGHAWISVGAGPLRGRVEAIWSSGPRDAWLLGQGCVTDRYRSHLLHWDGKAITEHHVSDITLRGLWGSSPTDVWVTGSGSIGHWDGRQWTWSRPWPALDVHALGGTGPRDVWAMGKSALHFEGRRWERRPSPLAAWRVELQPAGRALFATSDRALVALAAGGWTPLLGVQAPGKLRGLAALSEREVWAVLDPDGDASGAATAVRWDGRRWQGLPARREDVVALFSDPSTGLWAVSAANVGDRARGFGEVRGFWGGAWKAVTRLGQFPTRLWGAGPADLWVVGQAGACWRWDGRTWTGVPTGTGADLRALWGSGPADIWAAGDEGVLLRWNGRTWQRWAILDNAGTPAFHALWGSRADDVWAAGTGGLYHWDGRGWSRTGGHHTIERNGRGVIFGVWGSDSRDVWAVGTGGDVVTTDDDREKILQTPLLLHWDGKTWSRPATPVVPDGAGPLHAVWGRDRRDIWAAGRAGTLLHFDGRNWRSVEAGTRAHLLDVRFDAGKLWLATSDGLIAKAPPF